MKRKTLAILLIPFIIAVTVFYFIFHKQAEEFKILKEETIFLNESFGVKNVVLKNYYISYGNKTIFLQLAKLNSNEDAEIF